MSLSSPCSRSNSSDILAGISIGIQILYFPFFLNWIFLLGIYFSLLFFSFSFNQYEFFYPVFFNGFFSLIETAFKVSNIIRPIFVKKAIIKTRCYFSNTSSISFLALSKYVSPSKTPYGMHFYLSC